MFAQVGGTAGGPLLTASYSGLGAFRLGVGANCTSSLIDQCTAAAAAGSQEGADPGRNNNSSSSRSYTNAEGLASPASSMVTAAAATQREVQQQHHQPQHHNSSSSSSECRNTAELTNSSSTCTGAVAAQCTACQPSTARTLTAAMQPDGTLHVVCPGGGGKVLLVRGGLVVHSTQQEHSTQHEHSSNTDHDGGGGGDGATQLDDPSQLGDLAATIEDTLRIPEAAR